MTGPVESRKRFEPSDTVQQINLAYPACLEVFDRYGLAGCGGSYGPPEPLHVFASAHNIDLDDLIGDLEAAASDESAAAAPRSEQGSPPEAIFRPFLWGSLAVTLTLGSLWGAYNLTLIALARSIGGAPLSWSQAHGHAQLFGWVALFIMGSAYHVLPRFLQTPFHHAAWAKGSCWLMLAGVVLHVSARPWIFERYAAGVLVTSALFELAAIAIFSVIAARFVMRSTAPSEGYEPFVIAGIGWIALLGLWNVWTTWTMARGGFSVMFGTLNEGVTLLALLGFASNIIFGVSLRIMPNFLGLRPPSQWLCRAGFGLFNVGVLLSIFAYTPTLAPALLLAGAVCFCAGLKIFMPRRVVIAIPGVDGGFAWFVVQGYGFLLVGLVIMSASSAYTAVQGTALPLEFAGAARHAIAVGFVTSTMLGIGYRVLPLFHGATLQSNALLRLSFWLLLTGNVLRLGGQLAAPYGGGAMVYTALALSGYLQVAAIASFAWNVWRTLHQAAPVAAAPTVKLDTARPAPSQPGALTPDTRIAEIVKRHPQVRDVLIELGFAHLKQMPEIPPFVTLRKAAEVHKLELATLLERIQEAIGSEEKVQL